MSAAAVRAVLFDLDGTLLDTAPDMGTALNRLRAEHRQPPLPATAIRPWVSHGSRGLLRLGFAVGPDDAEFIPLRDRFLDLYQTNLASATAPFDGISEVLVQLERRGLPWGIVTNKPGWLTVPLLDRLALLGRAACVVSGDTVGVAKPHPEPLLYACRQIDIEPAACLYVGDAERDIEAARRAGMPALVAGYGYLGAADQPADWGARAVLNRPTALLDWLGENPNHAA